VSVSLGSVAFTPRLLRCYAFASCVGALLPIMGWACKFDPGKKAGSQIQPVSADASADAPTALPCATPPATRNMDDLDIDVPRAPKLRVRESLRTGYPHRQGYASPCKSLPSRAAAIKNECAQSHNAVSADLRRMPITSVGLSLSHISTCLSSRLH
jgi:hypothetical protein